MRKIVLLISICLASSLFANEKVLSLMDVINISLQHNPSIKISAAQAKATKATIEVLESKDSILLEVSDNGVGIENNHKTGIGLKNIKKRVAILNGIITISATKGTKISISIPL